MEKACKELEEMRCEMEMLRVENKANHHHSESLRRGFKEQGVKLQNARVEIEQQAKEIDAKSEENFIIKQKYEELQSIFEEKDLALKQLSLANEGIKTGLRNKINEMEKANEELAFALDEANVKAKEQNKIACAYKVEIQTLKGLLSESQKKYFDAELRGQASKELRRSNGSMLDELVLEKEEIENRLKWKIEQFSHLEEAFDRVREELRASKKEWEIEKLNLLDDISSLQSSQNFAMKVADDLRSQLQMCNQALAHEESQRRFLEIQIHESKDIYEKIALEYDAMKSNIAALAIRRDGEIASIRNLMSDQNVLLKELEYKNTYLRQENQELLESLKESQEAHVHDSDALASLKSFHRKHRALVSAHKECSNKLKTKEDHWNRQMTELSEDLDECLLKSNTKDNEISDLKEELEYSYCSAMQTSAENHELFVINIILKEKLMDICSDLKGFDALVGQSNEKAEERVTTLKEQLENKNVALTQALAEVSQERIKMILLLSKIELLEHSNGEYLSMKKELATLKGKLAELSGNIVFVKEQATQKELELQDNLKIASCALEKVKSSVSEKLNALAEAEFDFSESQENTRYVEDVIHEKMKMEILLMVAKENFLQQLEERESRIFELELIKVILEEQLLHFETSAVRRIVLPQSLKKGIEFINLLVNVNKKLAFFHTSIAVLEQNYGTRENAIWMNLENFRAECIDFQEKLDVLSDIQQRISSFNKDYVRLVEAAAALKLSKDLVESNKLNDVLDSLKQAQILDKQELQYKGLMIAELEETVVALLAKLESTEKLSSVLAGSFQCLQEQSAANKLHIENELKWLSSKQRSLEVEVKAKANTTRLYKIIENLPHQRELLSEQIIDLNNLVERLLNNGEEMRKSWNMILEKTNVELIL